MKLYTITLLGLVANLASAVELTTDNYDSLTAGKTVVSTTLLRAAVVTFVARKFQPRFVRLD